MRLGFASADITPVVPVEMAGYGYFLDRQATAVESPLGASALTFEDKNGKRAALCSVDLISVTNDTVERVQESVAKLSPDSEQPTILINASHTHSGPASYPLLGAGGYNEGYVDGTLVPQLASTINSAFDTAKDGGIGISRVTAPGLSYNRTGAASLDERVSVVKAANELGEVSGTHFACHPVVYGKNSTVLSGDYPSIVKGYLAKELGGLGTFWLTGACADIDPMVNKERKGQADRQDLVEMGEAIASKSLGAFESTGTAEGTLRTHQQTIDLPIDTGFSLDVMHEAKVFHEIISGNKAPKDTQSFADFLRQAAPVLRFLEAAKPVVNGNEKSVLQVPVTVIAIGKTVFVGLGAEVYTQTGLATESEHPSLDIVTMMNSNDHLGYVPPAQEYENPTYASRISSYIFGRKPLLPSSEAVLSQGISQAISTTMASQAKNSYSHRGL